MQKLTQHDWNHMHDCILHVTKKKSTREELVEIFNKLPEDMKGDAYEWGMSDTLWRNKFIEWYIGNMSDVQ